MQRLVLSLVVVFLGCLAVPGNLTAQDAEDAFERATALLEKGEYDKAIVGYSETIRLNPSDQYAYNARSFAWYAKGEYAKAIADLNQSLAIDPKFTTAHAGLAWLEATCPEKKYRDGKKAVENATKAYREGDWKNWGYLDILAAAYAESGDFEKAKELQTSATVMAAFDKSATDKRKRAASARLELYKQGKPYREEPKSANPH